jgi:hypothetical protein
MSVMSQIRPPGAGRVSLQIDIIDQKLHTANIIIYDHEPPMSTLENPSDEVLVHARGKGALLNDADKWAGFAPHRGHHSRLAHRDEVVERIAELRAAQTLAKARSAKAADRGEIAKDCSHFAGAQIRLVVPIDA